MCTAGATPVVGARGAWLNEAGTTRSFARACARTHPDFSLLIEWTIAICRMRMPGPLGMRQDRVCASLTQTVRGGTRDLGGLRPRKRSITSLLHPVHRILGVHPLTGPRLRCPRARADLVLRSLRAFELQRAFARRRKVCESPGELEPRCRGWVFATPEHIGFARRRASRHVTDTVDHKRILLTPLPARE